MQLWSPLSVKLACLTMFLTSVNVFAGGYYRGKDLLDFCNIDSKACGLYIMGVHDTHNAHIAWGDTRALHCMPSAITDDIIVPVVTKYLREHPESLHLGAAGLVLASMSEAWPCR